MSTETSITVVFLIVLVVMLGAAYSYYLLEQETKKVEKTQRRALAESKDEDAAQP
jgi:uncharacterized protein HemX